MKSLISTSYLPGSVNFDTKRTLANNHKDGVADGRRKKLELNNIVLLSMNWGKTGQIMDHLCQA